MHCEQTVWKPGVRPYSEGRVAPTLKVKAVKKGDKKAAAKAGYMDGMDLPSSEGSGEETEAIFREEKTLNIGGKNEKEERKARAKELEAAGPGRRCSPRHGMP